MAGSGVFPGTAAGFCCGWWAGVNGARGRRPGRVRSCRPAGTALASAARSA
jgi:hypothetical protein